jgi:hypothetical protein
MLSDSEVRDIKDALSHHVRTQCQIAADHGVSRSLISDIATGRVHATVGLTIGRKKVKEAKHDPTNARIVELEEEIVHLTDERNRSNARVKAGAKVGGLFRAIVKEMDSRVQPITALPTAYRPGRRSRITEHCVLNLSDWHADAVVRPEEVGGIEEFNFPIACRRAEHLIESTIDWTQNTLAHSFDFPVLWMLVYGDLSSGTIHGAAERSYYRNQFQNSSAIGTLFSFMVRDLAPHFGQVNVVCVSGNHGRTTPKKDFHGSQENFDYLIAEIARVQCRNIRNVSWFIPNSWSVNLDINGIGVNVSHGDDVGSNGGMPFYAMQRKQKNLIAINSIQGGQRLRYYLRGHHHVSASLSDMDGEAIYNGAWPGTDQFAYNQLSGYREPCQLLMGMHNKYGVSWRLPIKLKTPDEKKGPHRYKIDRGREVGPL